MPIIKVNSISLNVNLKGEGSPLILVHGLGRDGAQYDYLVPELKKSFKVIIFDCRGHGQSEKPAEYTLQDHIADILGIMDYYKIGVTYLLGVSAGSYIAQGVAIAAPERISKLILTVPKSNGLTSSFQRLFDAHEKETMGKNEQERILTVLKYFTCNPEWIKQQSDIFETKLTHEQFTAASKALAGFDFRKNLPEVTAKTLVISGKYDGLNSPEEGKEVASLIPHSKYVLMQHSGHLPIREEPMEYLRIIKEFLLGDKHL